MINICRKSFFYEQLKLKKGSFFEVPLNLLLCNETELLVVEPFKLRGGTKGRDEILNNIDKIEANFNSNRTTPPSLSLNLIPTEANPSKPRSNLIALN